MRGTPQKQAPNCFAILLLQVSRDMRGIAAGPLREIAPQWFAIAVVIYYSRSGLLSIVFSVWQGLVGICLTQRAHILKTSGFEHEFEIFKRDWNESHFQARLNTFKRAIHQTPMFWGEFSRSRLKFSSEIENFKRRLEKFKRSSEIAYFSRFGPICLKVRP